jgi:outer membrane protein OmpA-like peptidoglycan-associated protein
MKKIVTIISIVGTLLVACATTDPYTGERKASNATKGTVIGAASGAVVGAIAGKGKGALIGAASGAALGGGIGYYMDRQEAQLRQQLEGTGVRVERSGDNLKLILPGNITFATNSTSINGDFHAVLESVAVILKEFDKTNLEVIGYTDSTGGFEYNQRLSERRAESVTEYLVAQGVPPSRIIAKGMGERLPVAANDTGTGRAQNRRVELDIRPVAG